MPMEGWEKCLSPQNTFRVSGVNSGAAETNTIKVTGDHFFRRNKIPYCTCGVIQVSRTLVIQYDQELRHLHHVFSLNFLSDPPRSHVHVFTHTPETSTCCTKFSPKGTRGVRVSTSVSGIGFLGLKHGVNDSLVERKASKQRILT